ncbi:type II toxin-antitoxin system YafQ family toxin [Xylella fastidiosa subsp. pauca]|uniref:type II toxin-antitoxin system YafQ family toxin n=2 Tax=Xylella fastidiosa TaxID=2371 RepID=UPI0009BD2845|nr:type II toxin-antitoxin system YafQ family toxin [Xylella fastidiosa]TNW24055.1 type II toxin-antitoxin system YafQ family toxin [Xylella fastidiosa subsp. pauca]
MTSKKTAASKRAPLPRAADYAKSFLKDWERLSRAGRYDMNRLKEAMLLLIANDNPLGPEWLDHPLGGNWEGHRECHIGGDFLLAYKLDDSGKHGLIVFVRTGTHGLSRTWSSRTTAIISSSLCRRFSPRPTRKSS